MSGVKSCHDVRKMRAKRHVLDLTAVASLVTLMGVVSVERREKKPVVKKSVGEKREQSRQFSGEYCP